MTTGHPWLRLMAGCSLAAHAHVHWQLASGFVPIWASDLTKLSQGQVFHRRQCERRSQWRSSLFVGRQAAAVFAFVIVAGGAAGALAHPNVRGGMVVAFPGLC